MSFDAVQTIKDSLSMRYVMERYGYRPNYAGFVCCPFHNEKTPSMKVYEKDFHCFGCGKHGDIITFVRELFGLSFKDALRRIDVDFNLNLFGYKSAEEIRKSKYQQMQIRLKNEREKAEQEQANVEYWSAFDEWKRLQDNRIKYAPRALYEEWHPLFVEALQKMAQAEFNLDCAMERRREKWMNKQYR